MLRRTPTEASETMRLEPPYETNGSVIPVSGARPTTAARLTLVCGQALINLAAVVGLAPLTGITLPFVSYGGSSLIVSLASVGVLLNIAGHGGRAKAQVPDRGRGDGRPRAAVARRRGGARGARRDDDLRRVAGSRRGAARS